MKINQHLETLSLKDPDLRREALANVLTAEGIPFITQEEDPSFKNPRGVVNYLTDPGTAKPSLLFCAHYDAVPGSYGANDNASSLCVLIALAKELRRLGIMARYAFFDGEEKDCAGSRLYVSQADRSVIQAVVNLDVCGFGDTLAICGKGNEKKAPLRPFIHPALLGKYNGQVLRYLPKSDEASFSGSRIPAMSLSVVPRWDIQFLKAMASYGDGFLGRPPEFQMMLEQMEVTTTMHGGYRDAPQWVEEEAMEKAYSYLLEAIQAPPAPRRRFGLL